MKTTLWLSRMAALSILCMHKPQMQLHWFYLQQIEDGLLLGIVFTQIIGQTNELSLLVMCLTFLELSFPLLSLTPCRIF